MSDPQAAAGARGPTSSSAPSHARTRRSPTSCSSRSSAATSAGHEASSERQLAARFGVSRPTVREALGALEARGVVVTRVGRTFVAERDALEQAPDPSADDSPAEFMETRLVLEVAVARSPPSAPPSGARGARGAAPASRPRAGRGSGGAPGRARSGLPPRDRRADGQRAPDRAARADVGDDAAGPLHDAGSPELVPGAHAANGRRAPRDLRGASRRRSRAGGVRDGALPAGAHGHAVRGRGVRGPAARFFAYESTMFTVTDGIVLPTTVTGSWPRPFWYTSNLAGRSASDALADARYREELTDAVAVVLSDQERGPRHPHERRLPPRRRSRRQVVDAVPGRALPGIATGETVPASDEWVHPPGSLLAEVFEAGGCRLSSAGWSRAGRSSSTSCGGSRRPAPTSP